MNTYSFRLRNPEGSSSHCETETPVYKVCSVPIGAHVLQHQWGHSRDHQIEQPLSGCPQADRVAAQPVRGDLTDVDPADRAPAELERRSEEVNHDKRGPSCRGHRAFRRWVEADVEAEIEHENEHGVAGPYEGPPAAKGVGKEGDEDGAATHLDDSVDSSGQE